MPILSVTLTDEQFAALEREYSEFCSLLERAWPSPDLRPSLTLEGFAATIVARDYSLAYSRQTAQARATLIERANAETIAAVAGHLRRARLYGFGWVKGSGNALEDRYERAVRLARAVCGDLGLSDRYGEQLGRELADAAWPIEAVAHDFEDAGASSARRPQPTTAE